MLMDEERNSPGPYRAHRSRSPPPRRRYSRSPPRREYRRDDYDAPSYRSYRPRSRSPPPYRPRKDYSKRENPDPSRVLGVFGLNHQTSEDQVREFFTKFRGLEKVSLVTDRYTRASRGFAFVTFETVEDASAAREEVNGQELDGNRLRIDFSVTEKPHESTPGMYAGERSRPPPPPPRDYYREYRPRSRERYRREPSPYHEHHRRERRRSRSPPRDKY